MTTAPAIFAILNGASSVTSLLASYQSAACIFPNLMPSVVRQFPAIVYQGQSIIEGVTAEGSIGPHQQEVKVACLALSFDGAIALGNAVEPVLKNTAQGTYGGINIMGIFYTGDDESEEGEVDLGDGLIVHQKVQQFMVWFK